MDKNTRIIMEDVPGKEVALCHVIAHPETEILEALGLEEGAIGIFSVTPGEAAFLAADYITKSAAAQLAFVDRYLGTVLIFGNLSALETAMVSVVDYMREDLGFVSIPLTFS